MAVICFSIILCFISYIFLNLTPGLALHSNYSVFPAYDILIRIAYPNISASISISIKRAVIMYSEYFPAIYFFLSQVACMMPENTESTGSFL